MSDAKFVNEQGEEVEVNILEEEDPVLNQLIDAEATKTVNQEILKISEKVARVSTVADDVPNEKLSYYQMEVRNKAYSYLSAKLIRNKIPRQILEALALLETSDYLKSIIGDLIAKLPNGINLVYDTTLIKELEEMDPISFNALEGTEVKIVVPVNPFNIKMVFDQYITYANSTFNIKDMEKGLHAIKTQSDHFFIDINSYETLYNSMKEIMQKSKLKHSNIEFDWKDYDSALMAMCYFIGARFMCRIKEGVYEIPSKSYTGDRQLPAAWSNEAVKLVNYLNGTVPQGFRIGVPNPDMVNLLYNDVFTYYKLAERRKVLDTVHALLEVYVKSKSDFIVNHEKVTRKANAILQKKFTGDYFAEIGEVEKRVNMRRKVNGDVLDRYYQARSMGFEYPAISNEALASFNILYCATKGLKERNLEEKGKKQGVDLFVLGDSVGNRAPIISDILDALPNYRLIVDYDSLAKTTGKVLRIPQRDFHTFNYDDFLKLHPCKRYDSEGVLVDDPRSPIPVIIWMGGKEVSIVDNPPTVSADNQTSDQAVLQMAVTFAKNSVYQHGGMIFIHHDLMNANKMKNEIKYMVSFGTTNGPKGSRPISIHMMPYPSADIKSFMWFLYPSPKPVADVQFFNTYAHRVVEVCEFINAQIQSIDAGRPFVDNFGKYLDKSLAIRTMALIQYQRSRMRNLGSKYLSDEGEVQMAELLSMEGIEVSKDFTDLVEKDFEHIASTLTDVMSDIEQKAKSQAQPQATVGEIANALNPKTRRRREMSGASEQSGEGIKTKSAKTKSGISTDEYVNMLITNGHVSENHRQEMVKIIDELRVANPSALSSLYNWMFGDNSIIKSLADWMHKYYTGPKEQEKDKEY